MLYTYKALALIWLLLIALFAVSGLGLVVDSWVLLTVVAALGAGFVWTLYSKPQPAGGAMAPSQGRAPGMSDVSDHPSGDASRIDVYRWENDGGAAEIGPGGKYARSLNPV